VFPPEDLNLLADKLVDAVDPDGTLPNAQLNTDRRSSHLRACGSAGGVDGRTLGQRAAHEALKNLCDRQLRAGDLPDAGGIRPR
jgi:hypothetical protein